MRQRNFEIQEEKCGQCKNKTTLTKERVWKKIPKTTTPRQNPRKHNTRKPEKHQGTKQVAPTGEEECKIVEREILHNISSALRCGRCWFLETGQHWRESHRFDFVLVGLLFRWDGGGEAIGNGWSAECWRRHKPLIHSRAVAKAGLVGLDILICLCASGGSRIWRTWRYVRRHWPLRAETRHAGCWCSVDSFRHALLAIAIPSSLGALA